MKQPLSLLLGSLLVVSVALHAFSWLRQPSPPASIQPPAAPRTPERTDAQARPTSSPHTTAAPAETTSPVHPTPFHWRQVESEDYRTYIANLRKIGCPEATIHDIILADLNAYYAPRIAAVLHEVGRWNYWQNQSRHRIQATLGARQKLQAVLDEKRALLRDLFGHDIAGQQDERSLLEAHLRDAIDYGFLPPDKRRQLRELFGRYESLEQEIHAASGGWLSESAMSKTGALDRERRAELAALLSPEQLLEYDLHHSPAAENVRDKIAGLDVSEEQFRKMYEARKTYEEAKERFLDEGGGADIEQLRAERDAQYQSILGPARYDEFTRNQDFTYQMLRQPGEQTGLSQDKILEAYQMNLAADQQRTEVQANASLTPDQQRAALEALEQASSEALRQTLGDPAYDAFRRSGGQGRVLRFTADGTAMRVWEVGNGGTVVRDVVAITAPAAPTPPSPAPATGTVPPTPPAP